MTTKKSTTKIKVSLEDLRMIKFGMYVRANTLNHGSKISIEDLLDLFNGQPQSHKSVQLTMSTPLTFGELKEGDLFVDFPMDGDDNGHGGFRAGSYIFKKMRPTSSTMGDIKIDNNAFRLVDGTRSQIPDSMQVSKVYLDKE